MTGRIIDGLITLEGLTPRNVETLMLAMAGEAARHALDAARASGEARDRRELAKQQKRGRHANERVAGELEAKAAECRTLEREAQDLVRVLLPLVSASDPRSNSQLVEEGNRG